MELEARAEALKIEFGSQVTGGIYAINDINRKEPLSHSSGD